ncbi:hypothetical protein GCM10010277_07580 [Streptomyces longisporoflavus]|uniref:STAS domain-containing protein n=1 Tax=Streptomyces longisporoflavus TaxID=28044 RepID=UPI00167CDC28|nr:hypothetical protein [Streptomyces longisporoflavus]GGV26171.1 hypothetical protein GCM10010277_07580 [Streptomyces longisporoflavus]
MSLSSPARPGLCRTSRPLGVRLAGSLGTFADGALERCLAELLSSYPGRVIHVDLIAVTSMSLATTALLVTMDDRARRRGGELRLHLSPELERLCETTVRAQARVAPRD